MSLLSWIGLTDDPNQARADQAADAKVAQGKAAAIALENYRQNARDQYHTLLTQRMAPYQAYSNRLAAAYGQGMSTAGLAPNENPLTLQDTGVGAPQGSNYAGWDTVDRGAPGVNGTQSKHTTHHAGIQEQLTGIVPQGQNATAGDYTLVDSPDVAALRNPANNPTYNPSQAALPQGGGQPVPGGPGQYNFMPRRAP